MLLREDNHMLFVFFDVESIFQALSAVNGISSGHIDEFDIGLRKGESTFKCKLFDVENLRIVILME